MFYENSQATASGFSRQSLTYRLRTVHLRKVERHSRLKRKASRQQKHYRVSFTDRNGVRISKQKRGFYYVKFRRERQILKILQWTALPRNFKSKDRIIIRRLYYRTIPFLLYYLQNPDDQQIIQDIEETYYSWLNRAAIHRGAKVRVYRPYTFGSTLDQHTTINYCC